MSDNGMDPDGGGGGSGGGERRRRPAKQERPLYQPGKGLASSSGNSDLARARVSPAPRAGSPISPARRATGDRADPMDAVQQKLHEMSMRGPPSSVVRRYGGSNSGNSGRDRPSSVASTSSTRSGRGQGELWLPERNDVGNARGGSNINTNRRSQQETSWRSERRVNPPDRGPATNNDRFVETSSGGKDAQTSQQQHGAERSTGSTGDRRGVSGSIPQSREVTAAGEDGSSNSVAREERRQQQPQSEQSSDASNRTSYKKNNDVAASEVVADRDEVKPKWENQSRVPPRGNVSGRQLWVDGSNQRGDGNKTAASSSSWRSRAPTSNNDASAATVATTQQGTSDKTEAASGGGAAAAETSGAGDTAKGAGGVRKDRSGRRRKRGDRRPVDGAPDEASSVDRDDEGQELSRDEDVDSGDDVRPVGNSELDDERELAGYHRDGDDNDNNNRDAAFAAAQERGVAAPRICDEAALPVDDSSRDVEISGQRQKQQQERQRQQDRFDALCDVSGGSGDASGDQGAPPPLKFVDPEDDQDDGGEQDRPHHDDRHDEDERDNEEDSELAPLSLNPLGVSSGRIDWTECPTPPPLEELAFQQSQNDALAAAAAVAAATAAASSAYPGANKYGGGGGGNSERFTRSGSPFMSRGSGSAAPPQWRAVDQSKESSTASAAFRGGGGGSSHDQQRPPSAQTSDRWNAGEPVGGGRRRHDSEASSCWSQHSGRSHNLGQYPHSGGTGGGRRDRRMSEREGGRHETGSRANSTSGGSPTRRSPIDYHSRAGPNNPKSSSSVKTTSASANRDWDRSNWGQSPPPPTAQQLLVQQQMAESKRAGNSGGGGGGGLGGAGGGGGGAHRAFQAETLPPRLQRQRDEQLRLQQQQRDRQMLIERMQQQERETRDTRDARELQRKQQVQLLQQQREQQQQAQRELLTREKKKPCSPVEVENWRRRETVVPPTVSTPADAALPEKTSQPQSPAPPPPVPALQQQEQLQLQQQKHTSWLSQPSSAGSTERGIPLVNKHNVIASGSSTNNNINNNNSSSSSSSSNSNNNSNTASSGRRAFEGRSRDTKEMWTRGVPLPERRGSESDSLGDRQRNRRIDLKDSKPSRDFDPGTEDSSTQRGFDSRFARSMSARYAPDSQVDRGDEQLRSLKGGDARHRDVKIINTNNNSVSCGNNSNNTVSNNKPLMTVRPVPQVREETLAGSQRPSTPLRQPRVAMERNITEGIELEKELHNILPHAVSIPGGVKRLTELRLKIQQRYEHVILYDPRYSTERNVEQMLWKAVYHQVIEALRREAGPGGPRSSADVKAELCAVVEEGLCFYEGLLERMQELHGFRLDQLLSRSADSSSAESSSIARRPGPPPSTLKILLISAQKMLISLGDLCRYREQAFESANFARARDFYLRAQQLAPKNGKPYNQLALLAVYSGRKLDAVYYYMRSLAASNPFLSANESLTTLFDEVRKSFEALEKQRKMQKSSLRSDKAHIALPELARCEIWIRPDGSSWQRRGNSELEQKLELLDEINALSDYELSRRFTVSFLHVHGKLFSKIDMDHFGETAAQMLLELRALLRRPQPAGAGAKFLQLLAICMFSVANNSLKNTATLASNARSLMQERSVQIAMSLVAHIMEWCTERVEDYLRCRAAEESSTEAPKKMGDEQHTTVDQRQSEYPLVPGDVEELLPVLKVWTDWMSGHKMLWCPPPNPCDFATSTKCGDVWSSLADLLTILLRADQAQTRKMAPEFHTSPTATHPMEVLLPEDSVLAGFVPLLGAPLDTFYTRSYPTSETGSLRTALRISRLHFFGDYLCGLTPSPYFHFDVRRSAYGSLLPESNSNRSGAGVGGAGSGGHMTDEELISTRDLGVDEDADQPAYESQTGSDDPSEDEEVTSTDLAEDQAANPGPVSGEMEKLRRKKHLLQKRVKRHNRVQAYIERVLHNSRVGTTILEIRPRFLIPDTNCLVDHLDKVRVLVACKTFSIYIPIIVVNELDGLARGCITGARTHQAPAHAARVTAYAREALSYLESRFARREPKLRTITSRGNLLDSISFRTEAGNDLAGVKNDDLILSCAVSLAKTCAGGTGVVSGDLGSGSSLIGAAGGGSSGGGHILQPGETEAPLRLFREAVLLTEDRNLAVKAMAHNVPVRDITSFVRWAQLEPVEADM